MVIVDKNVHIEKMENILKDTSIFQEVDYLLDEKIELRK